LKNAGLKMGNTPSCRVAELPSCRFAALPTKNNRSKQRKETMGVFVNLLLLLSFLCSVQKIYSIKGYKKYPGKIDYVIKSPQPHQYLKTTSLPTAWDWRNVNGTNFCGKVLIQTNPNVCGSCWAEAATASLSDRYTIATGGRLRMSLAPQVLINFNEEISGGSCNGGDDVKSYEFMYKYGIVDDTCAPFIGLNWYLGYEVAAMTSVSDVQAHQCRNCLWNGMCVYVARERVRLYGVDEFGPVIGVDNMKAEIYARGPISCLINSSPPEFNQYNGGIITCNPRDPTCTAETTDHFVTVAGWGVDKETGMEYWIGRNSYGSHWGEGAGGGWFRLRLGKNELNLETAGCGWATPAQADVEKAIKAFESAL
jgi:cathepsin X